ncbi:Hypothetical predicted protein [Olea europaea subsp. europaea]|nr:Hypothetical predicted protein [Olea europaea subsp. europaea]
MLEPFSLDELSCADYIYFHRVNMKNDSGLEGLMKMADLVIFQLVDRSFPISVLFDYSVVLYLFFSILLVLLNFYYEGINIVQLQVGKRLPKDEKFQQLAMQR